MLLKGVSGALLAGGLGRRFGSDKALAPWTGGRLIEAGATKAAGLFEETLVAVKDPESYGFLRRPGIRLIRDGDGRRHPGVGLLAALRAAKTERVFVFACDMPALKIELVRFLCEAEPGARAVLPEWDGALQPMCAVYSRACAELLEELLESGDFSLKEFARRAEAARVSEETVRRYDPAGFSFMDIDTKDDHRRAEAAYADRRTRT